MVLSAERTMALYCPACAKVQFHIFSVFEIRESHPLQCKCGFTQGQIERVDKHFAVKILCPSGDRLRLTYTFREFWLTPLISFLSPRDGEEIGFLGEASLVDAAVAAWADDLYGDEEFVSPDVMHAILAKLQELARLGKISCKCERPSVGVDVYPDKVELICSFCGSAILMNAVNAKDVERVNRLSSITMERSSYSYLEEWLKPLI